MYNTNAKPEFPYMKNSIVNWKPPGRDARVYDNILHVIGNTPLVKLNRIPKDHGLHCDIYAKCEFLNPGGSIKDRIAYTMVVDAEATGRARAGTRFVEPTSGNTGIGVSLVAAVKGYNATIVTPDKNSDEKMSTMRALGADIVMTPSTASVTDEDHFTKTSERLLQEDPVHRISLDQYKNPANPRTHLEHTAHEILDALGRVDMAVIGAGTGGTLSGVARALKLQCPDCIIVAVDPKGSTLWGKQLVPFFVEGIGGDFIPDVLYKYDVDCVQAPTDFESFNMAREVIRKEGLLCGETTNLQVEGIGGGFQPDVLYKHAHRLKPFNVAQEVIRKEGLFWGGSSGAATYAAVKAAKEYNLGPGKKVVVIMADGIRNYMTKFVSDQWMEAQLFKEPPVHDKIEWWNHPLSCLDVDTAVPHVKLTASCREAVAAMGSAHSVALVVDDNWNYKGAVSINQLRHSATNPKKDGNLDLNESVNKHLIHKCYKVIENVGHPTVGLVSRILDITTFVVKVERTSISCCADNGSKDEFKPKGIITPEIVFQYILRHQDH